MSDISIRKSGRAGRITLTRPGALNALTHAMTRAIAAALDAWATDDDVALVIIDAAGDRAFCAGGDVQDLFEAGKAGDYEAGRAFWRDEYRLNARIAAYPKPFVAFMQGYTMGGGVGLACHGSHRIVCEASQVSMPECGIGLVPDVGGSWLLARAPGCLGVYLGLTTARMGPGDAIFAGFADRFLPRSDWPGLIAGLEETGDVGRIDAVALAEPPGRLATEQAEIDALFSADTLGGIVATLRDAPGDLPTSALTAMRRNSPLAMAATVRMLHDLRRSEAGLRAALDLEYRYAYRAMPDGDLLEGIRAAVIDKDRAPDWLHTLDTPPEEAAATMLRPLDDAKLTFVEPAHSS